MTKQLEFELWRVTMFICGMCADWDVMRLFCAITFFVMAWVRWKTKKDDGDAR